MQPTTDQTRAAPRFRSLAGAFALALAACGGAESGPAITIGGESANDGGLPPDAGLKAGANIEDCRTEADARLCGTQVECYAHGPDCDCIGAPPDPTWDDFTVSNAAVGFCGGVGSHLTAPLPCGECRDGELCALREAGVLWAVCVAEDIARVAWLHGFGHLFTYADGSPYNGVPIPSAQVCPRPDGDLELCGGDCGGCSKPGFYCTGRSPTHPLGICTSDDARKCANYPGSQRLSIRSTAPNAPGVGSGVCVRDCARLAATVPGGAVCIDPQ